MQRLFDLFRSRDLPPLTRPNFVAERQQVLMWGVVAGTVEAYLAATVAAKTFGASELLTTLIWALPVLMNVLNLGWGAMLRGWPRRRAFGVLTACAAVVLGSVGATSADWRPWGAWVFAAQIAATHLFLSGMVTVRTTMWSLNYPAVVRARITARLQVALLIVGALSSMALAVLYDHWPHAYRWVYPLLALVGLLSILPLRQMRVRREKHGLRALRAHLAQRGVADEAPLRRLLAGLTEALEILRTDRLFARYMLAQFLLGSANFFTDPFLINLLTHDLKLSYSAMQGIMYVTHSVFLVLSVGYFAPLFDRIGVLRFRVQNCALWTCSFALAATGIGLAATLGAAGMPLALGVILASRVLNGLGRGGGAVAWPLGHLQFAPAHQTELYMGVHVGLTGLRGLIAPLLSVAARQVLGTWAMVIPLILGTIALLMFRRLAAEAPSQNPPTAPRPVA